MKDRSHELQCDCKPAHGSDEAEKKLNINEDVAAVINTCSYKGTQRKAATLAFMPADLADLNGGALNRSEMNGFE